MTCPRAAIALLALMSCVAVAASERMLVKAVIVHASLDDVWHAWTTEDGLRFISAESNVELTRGGPYEWFIDLPPDENGKRGGEGAKVLAFLPKQMLAFSWTFPPSIPELRNAGETTQVVVRLTELSRNSVKVELSAHEWQEGEAWDAGFAYFDSAWEKVLGSLKTHFEQPPANPT